MQVVILCGGLGTRLREETECMDNYREYEVLNRLWDTGEAPWKIW